MAKYNEILVGRFNRAIQKFTGIKGAAPTPQLSGEFIPGWQFPLGREFRYLEGWDTFAATHFFAASAANNNGYRLRNPSGNNVIAVVEKFLVVTSVALDTLLMDAGITAADLGTSDAANIVTIDSRTQRKTALSASFTQAALVPALGVMMQAVLAANVSWDMIPDMQHELVILPGSALQFRSSTVNQASGVSLLWRERYLEEGERA